MKIFENLKLKFIKDTIWLYFSFLVFLVSGLAINLIILFSHGIDDLGVFIQIYTIYLIWSQFSTFGIHDSAQRHVAYYITDKKVLNQIKLGAILNGIFLGLFFSVGLYFFAETIGETVQSSAVGIGLKLISPAILFFSLNKILLSILNGERKIRLYSISQSLRSFLLLLFVIWISLNYRDSYNLAFSFLITEFILSAFLLFFINIKPFLNASTKQLIYWTKFHLVFGFKSFPIGFLYESYLKIDILMLSIFLTDKNVGMYSFAAMFFEGVYQIPHIIKTNVNPVLVSIMKKENKIKIDKFIKSLFLMTIIITSLCLVIIISIYPFLNSLFPNNLIRDTYFIIILLSFGLLFYSGFIPFDFIFLQAGKPLTQTFLLLINTGANIGLNFLFIPSYGIYGAAIATSLSLILSGITLYIFMSVLNFIAK